LHLAHLRLSSYLIVCMPNVYLRVHSLTYIFIQQLISCLQLTHSVYYLFTYQFISPIYSIYILRIHLSIQQFGE
jgi:hypothetical protein